MDHYMVLGCTPDTPIEELKKCYQELVKAYHPDKDHAKSSLEKFHRLDEAWKILRDPGKKKIYDLQLKQERLNAPPVYAVISFEELYENKDLEIFTYPCRCGGNYSLNVKEVTYDNTFVNCNECSFVLCIEKS